VELGRRLLYAFFEFFSERPDPQIGDEPGMGQGYQFQWIGLRDNLQENPMIFMGKSMVSG